MSRYIIDLGSCNITQTNVSAINTKLSLNDDELYMRFNGDGSTTSKIEIELYDSTYGISSSTIGLSSLSGFSLNFKGFMQNFDGGHETLNIYISSGTSSDISSELFVGNAASNSGIEYTDDLYYFASSTDISKIITNQSLILTVEINGGAIGTGDYAAIQRYIHFYNERINIFGGSVNATTISIGGDVYNTLLIGQIEIFYISSTTPPNGYLWCDGSSISTDTDENYRILIDLLNGNETSKTTGSQSAYLPNLEDYYPLGETTSSSISNYSSGTINTTGTNDLDINYFPEHSHTMNTTSSIGVTSSSINAASVSLSIFSNSIPDYLGSSNNNRDAGNGPVEMATSSHNHNIDHTTVSPPQTFTVPITSNAISDNTTISSSDTTTAETSISAYPKSIGLKFAIRYM